ncbi:hypothetical protein CAPTEDRAFT_196137 [Capitella teleta]|uniref:BEACH domain-containing protein n=1 Tax=Capitella teleta TaxID=283909 RepID=R7U708_CAPTE|nr:hypothetical protein CAPTEDRAFT_196137 [Capitella teleta]|eukprot:ELT99451.1 hypothetical protein CAPTEDRAFT_196137 [Capitella teleta]
MLMVGELMVSAWREFHAVMMQCRKAVEKVVVFVLCLVNLCRCPWVDVVCLNGGSTAVYLMLVHEDWISCLHQRTPFPKDLSAYSSLGPLDINLILAPSNADIASPWHRISVQPIGKTPESGRGLPTVFADSSHSHSDRDTQVKYPQAFQIKSRVRETAIDPASQSTPFRASHQNLCQVLRILESESSFYIVKPFHQYTLWDLVVFSPSKLHGCYSKLLFVVHQLVHAFQHCHQNGVTVGELALHDIVIDENLWIHMTPRNLRSMCHCLRPQLNPAVNRHPLLSIQDLVQKYQTLKVDDISQLVSQWVKNEISNLEYLMVLNHLAGRRYGDPNHHPILPWVMDFTSRDSGLRDLSKSKYRLNKGDRQLDLTYEFHDGDVVIDPMAFPHHISDFLSDITYYVYRARQTPKQILCKYVRSRWVPHEYPSNLQRLQAWTPDECIPEFFLDPTIFTSIHDDLCDLELPEWADSTEDLLQAHCAILEGPYVSAHLHQWIDITFGYKLTGSAAVNAKNVCLQMVNKHTDLLNHGVVQIFNYPHPRRLPVPSPDIPHPRPDISDELEYKDSIPPITLPMGHNFVEALENVENLSKFSMKTFRCLPPENRSESFPFPLRSDLVAQDMRVLGCLVAELAISPKLRVLGPLTNLEKRYNLAREVCLSSLKDIPRPLSRLLSYLLLLDSDWSSTESPYPSISSEGLPPPSSAILLQPLYQLNSFPAFMSKLYDILHKTKEIDAQIVHISNTEHSVVERIVKTKKLCKRKVGLWHSYLSKYARSLNQEGMELALPFLKELFTQPSTAAFAAWSLFHPLASALGPSSMQTLYMSLLTQLFDHEHTTPKYLKLYHRSFILQLIVGLRLGPFLENFTTRFIKASAGYKDFNEEEFIERQVRQESARVQRMLGRKQAPSADMIRQESLNAGEEEKRVLAEHSDGEEAEEEVFEEEALSLSEDQDQAPEVGRDALSTGEPSLSSLEEQNGGLEEVDDEGGEDGIIDMHQLTSTAMIRSETGEFNRTSSSSDYNISQVAAESIKWLIHRLGPVLAAKHLSVNLLQMLALCYAGEKQLVFLDKSVAGRLSELTRRPVVGDQQAQHVIECLSCVAILYGEHVILIQFFQFLREVVNISVHRLTFRMEGGLISSLHLLLSVIPFLSDSTLMDILEESIFRDILLPLLKMVSSHHVIFPGGSQARTVLCLKILDLLYLISLRIGFEMTRQHMTFVLQKFFAAFSRVHEKRDATPEDAEADNATEVPTVEEQVYYEMKIDCTTQDYFIESSQSSSTANKTPQSNSLRHSSTARTPEAADNQSEQEVHNELLSTFTPELAHTAYVMFCRLAGGIHMEQNLVNIELIQRLRVQHEASLSPAELQGAGLTYAAAEYREYEMNITCVVALQNHFTAASPTEDSSVVSGSFGRNVTVAGNKIVLQNAPPNGDSKTSDQIISQRLKSIDATTDSDKLRNPEMRLNCQRHLKGNWLAYWEHEIGRPSSDRSFNFKQIKLQSFCAHSNTVRSMAILDNENSFLSASKDRTVRLWVGCQWTYKSHRRSVFSVHFLESSRLVASCDGSVHVWDPFVGMMVREMECAKSSMVTVLGTLPAPHHGLVTASSDSVLRFIDVRSGSLSHEFRCSTIPAGQIRCLAVSPDCRWLAVGHSTGVLSTIDVRTGLLIGSWKGHENDVIQVKTVNSKNFVTTSLDQTVNLWGKEDSKPIQSHKGFSDSVNCINLFEDSVICAYAQNRIGVRSFKGKPAGASSKLKPDVFKGVLTSMEVLPLNRLLLLGADSGNITLLA